jgi:hypothetical protein
MMLLLLALARAETAPPPVPPPPAVEEIRQVLMELDSLIDAADKAPVRDELHRKVDRIEALLATLPATSPTVPTSPKPPEQAESSPPIASTAALPTALAVPTPRDRGPAASAQRYNQLIWAIDGRSFSAEKLGVVKEAALTDWFTVDQVAGIMARFDFAGDQVEAGVLLYPRVTNPAEWARVYEVLSFESSIRALRARTAP